MDPITAAITAVLPALAADTLKSGIKDAYDGLKEVIRRKWGEAAPISQAIAAVEEGPNSRALAAVVEKEAVAVKAADDPDVVQALQTLIQQMKIHGVGDETMAKIKFSMSGGVVQGVAGAETVTIGSMNFGAPPKA